MTTSLPPAARALVDATLARARLPARECVAVRAELEDHFRDGLDAGFSLEHLIHAYGDPRLAGTLIGRAKRRARVGVGTWAMTASAVLALVYVAAVVRLETAPSPSPRVGTGLDDEAAIVMGRVERADQLLASATGVAQSFAIAADLRSRHTLWAETESIILLDRTLRAADSLLSADGRAALADSLARLDARETLIPRRDVIDRVRPRLAARLYWRAGRLDRTSLSLLRRTKGVERPTMVASLLEPLYFARRLSRATLRQMVDAYVAARVRRADAASVALTARLQRANTRTNDHANTVSGSDRQSVTRQCWDGTRAQSRLDSTRCAPRDGARDAAPAHDRNAGDNRYAAIAVFR